METNKELKSLWEENLKDAFTETEKTNSEILMNILSIVVFDRFDSNIGRIYKVCGGIDKFSELIEALSDQTIRFPNAKEFREALTLALSYYYREVKGMSWEDVQKELPYERDVGLHNGKKIALLDRHIKKQLDSLWKKDKNKTTIFD